MNTPNLDELTANWTPQAKGRALETFVALNSVDKHAWYCDRGRICDGKPHEGYPYPHARGDQWPPEGLDWRIWAIFSGRGCVAPWTRIYDPIANLHIPIADLGSSFSEQVWTFDGPAAFEGPYRKGVADLWDVLTSDGCRVTVTDQHKFLTKAGWKPLADLHPWDEIAGGAPIDNEWLVPTHEMAEMASASRNGHNEAYRWNQYHVSSEDFIHPKWVEIDSITFSHHGEFWDLTVPGAGHYAAEGLWHHNSGKTRTGAEWVRKVSDKVPRIGMVGRRGVDVRAVMVEGDSGLITVCENAGLSYDWQPSKREFTFPNGCVVFGYSGEEPDSLRGPQHGAIWLDEPAHMPLVDKVWEQVLLSTRVRGMPGGSKILVTTTPLPIPWIKKLARNTRARISRVSTFANIDNLDPEFARELLEEYEGTRRGRQELYGEIIDDIEGALWTTDMLEYAEDDEEYERIVVAIDPAGTQNKNSDLTGIVVAAKRGNEFRVLADASGKYSPNGWATKAIQLYNAWQADAIIAEKNYGGDMVRSNIEHELERAGDFARIIVTTAMRSKQMRAEPVVGLYEQGRVKHRKGLIELESEMVSWIPGIGASPNRVDALVWGITELAGKGSQYGAIALPVGSLPATTGIGARIPKARNLVKGIFA